MEDAARRVARLSRRTIFSALLDARRRKGGATEAIIDADGRRFTYTEIVRAAFALGSAIARSSRRGEKIGILLPTSAGALIAFFATLAYGRVPAMLNFTAGARALNGALRAGEVRTILTSRKFVEIAKLEKLVGALDAHADIVYLEDLKETLKKRDKARAAVGSVFPRLLAPRMSPNAPGVILFTSGTEGDPKGVVLSHANIVANVEQINALVTLRDTDIIFNPLPIFHCYGLTAGALFPLFQGVPLVLHPSPLQTKIIPARIEETGATLLFATDTFLQQYMRSGSPTSLASLRVAVCGAERVRDETREAARRQYAFEVLEGYGVTEAAPVLAANHPDDIRAGTVGRLLTGIDARIEPVEGMDDDAGRLFVRGPNIMLGYISADRPGEIQPLEDGWHDTGDIVSIDDEGYVSIRGRAKRFAKIGGELVSLAVVENCAGAVWPDCLHAAIVVPDPRKGEQVVLVTECKAADRARLLTWAQSHGVNELAVPKKLVAVDAIPVLGTGKVNYPAVLKLALAARNEPAPTDAQKAAE